MITTITILLFTATFGAASKTIAAERSLNNNNYMLAYAESDTHAEHQRGHDGDGGMKSGDGSEHHMPHGKCCNMMSKADSDKDGKISKEEFLKHHEAKFEKKDLNNDGFIDKDEMHKMMKKHMHGHGHGHDHGKKETGDKAHGDMQE